MNSCRKETALHVLYNNAGVMGTPKGQKSPDGYKSVSSPLTLIAPTDVVTIQQWAVNVFGPFVFTYHLLPLLQSTAASSPPNTVRIINTASVGAKQAPKTGIPLDNPEVGTSATPFQCYGHSKLGNILLTKQLAQRYPEIVSLAPHPGPVQSELIRELGIPGPVKWILNVCSIYLLPCSGPLFK